jgi:tripartite-type tricarboxylate transporter receptor subunit TctC
LHPDLLFSTVNAERGPNMTGTKEDAGSRLLSRRDCFCAFGAAVAASVLPGTRAYAADWPARQVNVIVPYAAGGFTDMLARLSAKYLADKFGQSFLVENRPGAGGAIGTTYMMNSPPDGYTLMFGSASQPGIAPLIQKINYDPNALVPISIFGKIPFLLAVGGAFPADDLAGFIKVAKAKGSPLNASMTGYGATSHLLITGFAAQAGLQITAVPYKGSAPAAAAVLQGDVDMTWAGVSDLMPFIADHRVKVLAVSAAKRISSLPNVPSVSEALPGFSLETWNGYFGPPNIPRPIVELISSAVQEAAAAPAIHGRLLDLGINPVATSPSEMAATMQSDKAFYRKAVEAAGLKPQ